MGRNFNWRAGGVMLSEQDGVRRLHLGGERVQSAMRLSAPDALELHYTQAMMGFLMFQPAPRRVLMVGLGGGSLARFVHRRLPGCATVAVEVNPKVVAAARAFFGLPADDARLRVEVAEGAEYVARCGGGFDALLVDGFEDGAQAPSLCSAAFYGAARDALAPGGVLAVNFLARDRHFDRDLGRIEAAFGGRVACLPAASPGNLIVFALVSPPDRLAWRELRERAGELEARLGLPFGDFVSGLRRFNPCNSRQLILRND